MAMAPSLPTSTSQECLALEGKILLSEDMEIVYVIAYHLQAEITVGMGSLFSHK